MGRANAAVFPEPVSARPMMSLPTAPHTHTLTLPHTHTLTHSHPHTLARPTLQSHGKTLSLDGGGRPPVQSRARLTQNLRDPLVRGRDVKISRELK